MAAPTTPPPDTTRRAVLTVQRRLAVVAVVAVLLPLVAVAALLVLLAQGEVDAGWWIVAVGGTALVAATGVLTMRVARQVGGYVAELEARRAQFRLALGHLGEALASTDDREALAGVMLDATRSMVDATVAVFYADAGHHLVALAHRGAPNIEGRRVERGRGLVGSVAEQGEPARWPPAPAAPAPPEPEVGAAMAVPLYARNRLYGVLALYGNRRGEPFHADELDDVVDFARQAEVAIDTSYLHEEARRLSVTDGLTGVWNRRHFDLRCSQELDRARRFGEEFAVVMCDLDGFKAVNDTHGHQVGDAVLVEMAQRLVDEAREVDLVARYGGEEFVLVLSRTDVTGAAVVAERIRNAVAREPFTTDAGPLGVTVSLGVASHPQHGDSVSALLGAADAALYEAKETGRNRVCYAPVASHADGATAS